MTNNRLNSFLLGLASVCVIAFLYYLGGLMFGSSGAQAFYHLLSPGWTVQHFLYGVMVALALLCLCLWLMKPGIGSDGEKQ